MARRENSEVREDGRRTAEGENRQPLRKRGHPMRYEGGRPEPRPTGRDICAAWALAGVLFFGLFIFSIA